MFISIYLSLFENKLYIILLFEYDILVEFVVERYKLFLVFEIFCFYVLVIIFLFSNLVWMRIVEE